MTLARILALSLVVMAQLVLTSSAAAGRYIVYSCKLPDGSKAPVEGWTPAFGVASYFASAPNNCSSGGALEAKLPGDHFEPSGAFASWYYTAPPNTTLAGFSAQRSMSNTAWAGDYNSTPVSWIAWPTRELYDSHDTCGRAFGCGSEGVHDAWSAPTNFFASGYGNPTQQVFFMAGCGSAYNNQCESRGSSVPMAEIRVHAFAAYLQDDADPQADAVTGALTQAGPHRGQESIRFNATDVGAGVFRASIDVKQEGQAAFDTVAASVIDDNGGKCQPVEFDTTTTHLEFVHAVPCRLQVSADLDLDTASLPDGDHQLRVAVEDAAGNATTVYTGELEVDNIPPPAVIDAPGISGVPRQDATLHGNQGTWTGAANTYTFQWLRCASEDVASCAPIPGAQAADYRPAVADLGRLLRFEVTTTNREGTTTAASAAVGPIARADDTTPTPTPTATATPSPSTRGDANGANASDHARLTLTGPRTRTLALGHSAETTLTLRDENGKPISGASVAVLQRMAVPGAQWVAAHSPVITDSDGRVRYLIEPAYSRGLRFAYRSHAGDPQFSAVRDLTLRVRSKTTLRTNRRFLHNGQTVRFLGRLVSRPVPAAGVVIDLQARVGRHWQTFTTIRTRADGRWHAGYRFRSTTGFQTYVFRARVRGDTGFPYTPSISARTRVHVRG